MADDLNGPVLIVGCVRCEGTGVIESPAWAAWFERNPHTYRPTAEDPYPDEPEEPPCPECEGTGGTLTVAGVKVADVVRRVVRDLVRKEALRHA